jgi:hypothetical protein
VVDSVLFAEQLSKIQSRTERPTLSSASMMNIMHAIYLLSTCSLSYIPIYPSSVPTYEGVG